MGLWNVSHWSDVPEVIEGEITKESAAYFFIMKAGWLRHRIVPKETRYDRRFRTELEAWRHIQERISHRSAAASRRLIELNLAWRAAEKRIAELETQLGENSDVRA